MPTRPKKRLIKSKRRSNKKLEKISNSRMILMANALKEAVRRNMPVWKLHPLQPKTIKALLIKTRW